LEHIAQSENLRITLRGKDGQMLELQSACGLLELEQSKWAKEHEQYEERIAALENELEIAQETHRTLDEQKHENLKLKETIDRMSFEMDELRAGQSHSVQPSGTSQPASISRSLGAELQRTLLHDTEEDQRTDVVEEHETEDEDSDGEYEIQTTTKTIKKTKKVHRGDLAPRP
jgi:hypothetical protein